MTIRKILEMSHIHSTNREMKVEDAYKKIKDLLLTSCCSPAKMGGDKIRKCLEELLG